MGTVIKVTCDGCGKDLVREKDFPVTIVAPTLKKNFDACSLACVKAIVATFPDPLPIFDASPKKVQ